MVCIQFITVVEKGEKEGERKRRKNSGKGENMCIENNSLEENGGGKIIEGRLAEEVGTVVWNGDIAKGLILEKWRRGITYRN